MPAFCGRLGSESYTQGDMSSKKRPKTRQVAPDQILGERPESQTAPASPPRRPPVRERGPTSLYHRIGSPVTAGPTEAPPTEAPPSEHARKVKPAAPAAHRQFVAFCPIPLVQLDELGNVLWANEPFCDFVREPRDTVVGKRVDETRLGVVYPQVIRDLRICAEQVAPPTVKQVVVFEARDGRSVTWLCWLVPETNDLDEVQRFFGYLCPLQEQP